MRELLRYVLRQAPTDGALLLVDLYIGFTLLLSSPRRTSSPSFAVAKDLAPIRLWGVAFLVLGLILGLALSTPRGARLWYFLARASRAFGAMLYFAWGVNFLVAALTDERASFAGFGVYSFFSYRHAWAPWPLPPRTDDA